MEPGRAERVSSATIQRGGKMTKSQLAIPAVISTGRGQHREYRRVGVVEADGVDGVEALLDHICIGSKVAVPGDHV